MCVFCVLRSVIYDESVFELLEEKGGQKREKSRRVALLWFLEFIHYFLFQHC